MNKKDNPKTEKIEIRCTQEEKEAVKTLALAVGLGMSEFLLSLAIGDKLGQMMIDGWKRKD